MVSIIAVSYNHSPFVIETLNSILLQTYKNWELIIVDDCSKDDTVEKIENWIKTNNVRCKFIKHDQNQGVCKTFNEGLTYCKGEFLQIISCDDILNLDKLEKQVSILNGLEAQVAFLFSDAYIIENGAVSDIPLFLARFKLSDKPIIENLYELLLEGNFIPAMSALIRMKIAREMGGFDESLPYEDYDFWLRVTQKYKCYFSEYPSVKYRLHENNLHANLKSKQFLDYWVLIKHKSSLIARERINKIIYRMAIQKNDDLSSKNVLIDIKKNHLEIVKSKFIRWLLYWSLPLIFYRKYYQFKKIF